MNSAVLGTHDDEADRDTLAKSIGATPAGLESGLRELVDQGLVTI